MSPPDEADPWFERYGLTGLVRISDPDKTLYRSFGLEEGTVTALAHPRVWWPWLRTAILHGRGVGAAGRNWRQLPGVFLVHAGQILAAMRPPNSAARPDYVAFVQQPS